MIGRATGYDIDPLQLFQLFLIDTHFREINLTVFYIGINGITNCLRLLMNLF